mgnify:CR=1 FL=1
MSKICFKNNPLHDSLVYLLICFWREKNSSNVIHLLVIKLHYYFKNEIFDENDGLDLRESFLQFFLYVQYFFILIYFLMMSKGTKKLNNISLNVGLYYGGVYFIKKIIILFKIIKNGEIKNLDWLILSFDDNVTKIVIWTNIFIWEMIRDRYLAKWKKGGKQIKKNQKAMWPIRYKDQTLNEISDIWQSASTHWTFDRTFIPSIGCLTQNRIGTWTICFYQTQCYSKQNNCTGRLIGYWMSDTQDWMSNNSNG